MKECSKELTETLIGCAIEVHRTLAAGLLENTYEKCLAYELSVKNVPFIVFSFPPSSVGTHWELKTGRSRYKI